MHIIQKLCSPLFTPYISAQCTLESGFTTSGGAVAGRKMRECLPRKLGTFLQRFTLETICVASK